jgi:Ca2+-binding EF-hand superfamily protein
LFAKYELNFKKIELKDIIQSNDYNKNGTLEFNEFVNILLFKKSEDLSREYRMIFRQFDKNQDGTISV